MSAFSVRVRASQAIDLTREPLATPPGRWTHPSDYAATQALGAQARAAGIAAIRTPSARHAGGVNLAVLDPETLIPPPRAHSSWAFTASSDGLIATREMSTDALRFTPGNFA